MQLIIAIIMIVFCGYVVAWGIREMLFNGDESYKNMVSDLGPKKAAEIREFTEEMGGRS